MTATQTSAHARTLKSQRSSAPADSRIITVDYAMSRQDMIAAGRYYFVDNYIRWPGFPIIGTGVVELETKVFQFDRRYISSSSEASTAIKADDTQNPWEPAPIEALLAYGTKYPETRHEYPLVGLGSLGVNNRNRVAPCIDRMGDLSNLNLEWWDKSWDEKNRFLAVRKVRRLPTAA
jgi:hypothetical protein